MVHKRETLTKKEHAAQNAFMAKLKIKKRETKKPVIVAIIGLVGSGKSSVTQELAKHIGATVIEGDDIRIELRKQSERYERARAIAENAAIEVINQDGDVILDSDFVDAKKRASIREKARKAGVRLIFVRTHCDLDVMVGRILTATYRNRVDDFFGGASSKWTGSEQSKGAAVKIREMWRRTPQHYRWINQGGGKWILKKLPFAIFAEIDTTDPKRWRSEIEKYAKKLLAF
ncbi:AAA family ATPase [Patescibacteria group bacterium]|nr:AAA family ATPase [Patescibacteria group bacterium]